MYCTPIWKIRKVVYKAQLADSVIQHGEKESSRLLLALQASDSAAAAKDQALRYATERGAYLESALSSMESLQKEEHRKMMRWKVAAIFAGVVIVAQAVFGQ